MHPVRLDYRLTEADFAALAALDGGATWRFWFIMGLAGIAFLVGTLFDTPPVAAIVGIAPPFGEIALIGGLVLVWYLVVRGLRIALRPARARRMAAAAGPVRVSVGPGGIAAVDGRSAWGVAAKDIMAMNFTADRIFVFTRPGTVLVVPRTAFADQPAMAAFAAGIDDLLASEDAGAKENR